MKLSGVLKALVFGGLTFTTSQALAVNLINNYSFEDPVPTNNGGMWQVYNSISGWETPLNYIEIQRNGLYGSAASNQAPHGYQWAEVDAPGAGDALRQSVATENGASYSLSFYYSGRPGYALQEMGVYWNNSLVAVVTNALTVSSQNLNWAQYNFSLVGTGTTGVLSFASLKNYTGPNDAGGNLLDYIVLTKTGSANVPEPASLLLLSSGLLFARRFKKA